MSAPTCTASGQEKLVCDICGAEQVRELAATGHVWDGGTVTKEPTVYSDGVKTYTCSVCGKKRSEAIPALPAQKGQDEGSQDGVVADGSARGNQTADNGDLPQTRDTSFASLVPLAFSILFLSAGVIILAAKRQRSRA